MDRPTLRIFHGQSSAVVPTGTHVSVRLGDVGPLLADAYTNDRTWTRDFFDQKIRIPTDLYEVIRAYRSAQRA